jgi:hypothetical protein
MGDARASSDDPSRPSLGLRCGAQTKAPGAGLPGASGSPQRLLHQRHCNASVTITPGKGARVVYRWDDPGPFARPDVPSARVASLVARQEVGFSDAPLTAWHFPQRHGRGLSEGCGTPSCSLVSANGPSVVGTLPLCTRTIGVAWGDDFSRLPSVPGPLFPTPSPQAIRKYFIPYSSIAGWVVMTEASADLIGRIRLTFRNACVTAACALWLGHRSSRPIPS